MNAFIPSKRKLVELLVMLITAGIFYFFYQDFDAAILFIFGFTWNWTASIDHAAILQNRKYKFSMLRTVVNLQKLMLKPFVRAPEIIQHLIRVFPAGLFWLIVIYINDSVMPWWSVFVGSAAFELMQLELKVISNPKGTP